MAHLSDPPAEKRHIMSNSHDNPANTRKGGYRVGAVRQAVLRAAHTRKIPSRCAAGPLVPASRCISHQYLLR
jgi:hypothetical protein